MADIPIPVSDSILGTIKKMLGIDSSDTAFDTDVIVNIDSVLMVLNQLGIGPEDGLSINDDSSVWDDLAIPPKNFGAIKTYIYLKVKIIFDPPASSTVLDAMTRQITELEWRLNVQAEKGTFVPDITPIVNGDDEWTMI